LWVVSVLAVTYGSLYPLQFAPPADLAAAWQRMLFDAGWWRGTGDVVANIVLFVPVGALSWLVLDRWQVTAGRRVLWVLVGGFLFGLALQVLQLWLPRRVPQLSDAVWNLIGLLPGLALAEHTRAPLQRLARMTRSPHHLAYAMGALWLAATWWPLLPALNRRQLRWAWHEVLLGTDFGPADLAAPALGLACVLHLLRQAPWRAGAALALPLLALAGKLFFSIQVPSAGQPIGWLLGAALGALSWRLPARGADIAMTAAAAAALVAPALWPWSWSDSAATWPWLPLLFTLEEQRVLHTLALLWQLYACAALMLGARRLGLRPRTTALLTSAALLALEIVQRWMPAQQPDIAPVLLPLVCLLLLRSLGQPTASGDGNR
jgi:hypothetical protein